MAYLCRGDQAFAKLVETIFFKLMIRSEFTTLFLFLIRPGHFLLVYSVVVECPRLSDNGKYELIEPGKPEMFADASNPFPTIVIVRTHTHTYTHACSKTHSTSVLFQGSHHFLLYYFCLSDSYRYRFHLERAIV